MPGTRSSDTSGKRRCSKNKILSSVLFCCWLALFSVQARCGPVAFLCNENRGDLRMLSASFIHRLGQGYSTSWMRHKLLTVVMSWMTGIWLKHLFAYFSHCVYHGNEGMRGWARQGLTSPEDWNLPGWVSALRNEGFILDSFCDLTESNSVWYEAQFCNRMPDYSAGEQLVSKVDPTKRFCTKCHQVAFSDLKAKAYMTQWGMNRFWGSYTPSSLLQKQS